MSSSLKASSSSTPNFQPIFEKALQEYKKKTGKDLTAHPLAAEIKGCNSPEDILTVLEGKASELNQSRSSDERLTKWLNPTVNILNALSATLGEGAGLVSYRNQTASSPRHLPFNLCPNVNFQVFPPTKTIFSGIGILLIVSLPARFFAWVARTSSLAGGKEHCGEPRCAGQTLRENRKLL